MARRLLQHDGVPVYAESVDGWMCHLFSQCRSAERDPQDPPPAWYSTRPYEELQVECEKGAYLKIHHGAREGWVRTALVTHYSVVEGCYLTDM